ncbi:MAG: RnfABCDGE type electron transport complex subunit B [Succinivibrio sp.]|jgi:electron transport complex protein RnfB|nr:RnfABCDGE type electron transport complex subunit B [Succinivibrio sp.]
MSKTEFIIYFSITLMVVGFILSVIYSFVDSKSDSKEKRLETLLPGINCGQCGYPGCSAYAKALAAGKAQPNLCKPAGADIAIQLSSAAGIEISEGDNYEEQLFAPRQVAYIHESTCNGCGKCKRNCKVDAISGLLKQPHIVDPEECIGCNECISACPQKCIELIRLDHNLSHFNWNIHSVQI